MIFASKLDDGYGMLLYILDANMRDSPLGTLLRLVVDVFGNSFALVQYYFVPFFIAGTASLIFTALRSWSVIRRRVAVLCMVTWLPLSACGVVVLLAGLCTGILGYTASAYAIIGDSSDHIALELLSDNGRLRVFVLLLVSGAAMSGFGAAGGGIQWRLFRNRFPRIPLEHWVSANARFWPVTYLGSLIGGLVMALVFRGLAPAFVIGIGAVIAGLFAGGRISKLAVDKAMDEEMPTPEIEETTTSVISAFNQRPTDVQLPVQHGLPVRNDERAINAVRIRPSGSNPLLLFGALVLLVGVPIILGEVTKLTPEEAARAEATATAVARVPLVANAMRASEFYTENANSYLAAGDKQLHDEFRRKAIKSYDYAIDFDPGYAPAYYERAVAHEALGEYELARSDLQQVLELSSDQELKTKAQHKLEELADK